MKIKTILLLGIATLASVAAQKTFAASINITTGTAAWQQMLNGSGSGFNSVVSVSPNPSWAPAPTGSSWVSFGTIQSISCTISQTPGTNCASPTVNTGGDVWTYQLNITAAQLGGATSGSLNFLLGSDNRVSFTIGNGSVALVWNGGSNTNGTGFTALGCSAPGGLTNAGSTNPYSCTTSITFGPSQLNGDGSLTLRALNYNDPIPSVNNPNVACTACGNPTGFLLAGTLTTPSIPEPATFSLVSLAGLLGAAGARARLRSRR